MRAPDILAFVLAGGQGSRLLPLTEHDAKPALQLRDGYRLIDFVLSNLLLSGIQKVYLLAQYKPDSLIAHLRSVWLDRFNTQGGFIHIVIPGNEQPGEQFRGTADAVFRQRHLIEQHRPDLVAVFAADHVYRMDVRQMARAHRAADAHLSIAAVPVPIAAASSLGVLVVDDRHHIVRFEEKPERPTAMPGDEQHAFASMGNYLFDPQVLCELLEANAARGGIDFGYDILPRLPSGLRALAYDFSRNRIPGLRRWEVKGYWRDVGTVPAFREAVHEVSAPRARFELHNPRWPILGVRDSVADLARV